MSEKIIIAIDGYSSCGKSTLAQALAQKLNYIYVDSGAMYRAVTLYFLENNIDLKDIEAVKNALQNISITFLYEPEDVRSSTYLNGRNVEKEIRDMAVTKNVSPVSAIKEVRQALVRQQKSIGKNRGIVMDGRDIGTVVFPDAELKIFMTADFEVRSRRRYEELQAKGMNVDMDFVRKNLEERDYIDSHREESPLSKAEDAVVVDNSEITEQEQLELVYNMALEKIEKKR